MFALYPALYSSPSYSLDIILSLVLCSFSFYFIFIYFFSLFHLLQNSLLLFYLFSLIPPCSFNVSPFLIFFILVLSLSNSHSMDNIRAKEYNSLCIPRGCKTGVPHSRALVIISWKLLREFRGCCVRCGWTSRALRRVLTPYRTIQYRTLPRCLLINGTSSGRYDGITKRC